MIEYAVNLKIGSTPDLVLMSTITSDLNTAKEHLERTNREIRAEKISGVYDRKAYRAPSCSLV